MANSLSNLVDNLAKAIHKTKYKFVHDHKTAKRVELNAKTLKSTLNTHTLKII